MNNITQTQFDSLHKRYFNPLISFSKKIVHSNEAAEDTVQETFSRLCKQDFAKIENHATQWLFLVCRNLSLKALKKQQRYVPMLDDESDVISEENNPHEELDLIEQKIALKKCIKKLTPMQKKAIELRFFKDCSTVEIAKKMKISTGCVAFHICKGSQNLRQMMAKELTK